MYIDYHKPDFCTERCVQPDPQRTNPPLKYPDDYRRPTKLRGFELAFFLGFEIILIVALALLMSSQSILIVWSKRNGKYNYSITTSNFMVETLKGGLSLLALARIWRSEGVTEDNRLSTTMDEVIVTHSCITLPSQKYGPVLHLCACGCPGLLNTEESERYQYWRFV
ncbi:hypothetical protein SO802_002993 [Lithocarpus litseifolius]|uniref:Uncharacterized protein n=1 Tax=Lithocarpus litseifolius TaxID=425828 RepID=A0AAW2E2J7_9ROSI